MKFSKFTIVFLAIILITRFLLYFTPRTSTIYTDNFHHIYIGIFFLIIYFFLKHRQYSEYLLAITLGLIVDQITVLPFYLANLMNNNYTPFSYWSLYSIISTIIIIIISIILIQKYENK